LAEAAPLTAPDTDDRWIDYDIAFHRGLIESTDITPLASFCDLLQIFFQKYRAAMGDRRSGAAMHGEIVELLAAKELEKAVALVRHHVHFYTDAKKPSHDPASKRHG
jgi:DNA-binding GntR family transcriptional regulator